MVYIVTCTTCNFQYVGKTNQEIRKRHYGHRCDVRNGIAVLGSHFKEVHGGGMNLKDDHNLKTCLSNFKPVIVASVKPPSIFYRGVCVWGGGVQIRLSFFSLLYGTPANISRKPATGGMAS